MIIDWIDRSNNIGQKGPDNGTILFESELSGIAGIVFERKRNQSNPLFFAVTLFIFNKLLTTSYFHSESDALEHVEAVKLVIKNFYQSPSA